MSTRDLVIQLVNNIPESKLGYVLAYLQGMTADDASDEAYCSALLDDYNNSDDKGDFVSLDDAATMLGVNL